MSQRQNNSRSKQGTGRGILVFSLILIIGLIIGLVAVLPQFYITRIEVDGERKLTEAEILQTADIGLGKHLFLYVSGDFTEILQLRYGAVEDQLLLTYPYLEDVTVRAVLPYTVKIEVKERVEVAYLKTVADYVVVDSQGMILERVPLTETLRAPVLEGVPVGALRPGELIPEESKRYVDRSLVVINSILRIDRDAADGYTMLDHIQGFYPFAASTMYIRMENTAGETIDVRLNPSSDVEGKLLWLRNSLQQGVLNDLGTGVLDLSGKQNVFSPSQTVPPIVQSNPTATGTSEGSGTPTTGSSSGEETGATTEESTETTTAEPVDTATPTETTEAS